MSNLLNLIAEWKETSRTSGETADFRTLFNRQLHSEPYYLRYALDKQRPDLFLIYQTDRSDKNNPVVKECNGIILNKNDFSIVAYGMNGRVDETEAYYAGQKNIDLSQYDIEEVEDGAVLTVYNYEGEWIVATKRSIDASRVRWSSSRNFLELLADALPSPMETFAKDLDPAYTYSFVLLHPENHLVLLHPNPELVYVSRRHNETLEEENISGQNVIYFPWAIQRRRLSSEEAQENLTRRDRMEKRGVMLLTRGDARCTDRIKIDYRWFHEADKLRKGMPSMHLSYLACSPEEKQRMRQYFGNLIEFKVIDDYLRNLVHFTYKMYRESYVRKLYRIPFQYPIYKTLRILHYEYRMSGEPVRIHHVAALIDRTPCHILDSMLKFFAVYGFHTPPPPTLTFQQPLPEYNDGNDGTDVNSGEENDDDTVKAHPPSESGSVHDIGQNSVDTVQLGNLRIDEAA